MTTTHLRTIIVRAIAGVLLAAASPCLAQVPPLPCGAPGGGLTVRGRIMDPPGGGLDGVACCDVLVVGGPGDGHVVRTRADGTFETCFECVAPDPTTVSATPQCCPDSHAEQLVPQCFDPANGMGVVVDLGNIQCGGLLPWFKRTAIQGSVLCRSGALLEPVADCGILLYRDFPFGESVFTRTDASGNYESCLDCEPAFDVVILQSITAQCCGETVVPPGIRCPERFQVPTMICDRCPVPPCALPRDIEIQGRLTCDFDGDTLPEPVAGCDVRLALDPAGGAVPDVTVTTDADGFYRACSPCPADGAAPGSWMLVISPSCCQEPPPVWVDGCPPIVDVGTLDCCALAPPSPCPPDESIVRGRVTCVDPAFPVPQPMVDCLVLIAPTGGAIVEARTDASGDYSACVPCSGIDDVLVEASCCRVGQRASISCARDTVVDLACSGCPPCTSDFMAVGGRVTCVDAAGLAQPVASCQVNVRCANDPGLGQVVTTDADGDYHACVGCFGCDVVIANALCCNSAAQLPPLPGCDPLRLDVACGSCTPPPDPCSPEQTIAGRVTCDLDGDGVQDPLAGCPVRVECVGVGGFDTIVTTDASGDYVACLPCTTCTLARATALCCGQSTEVTLAPPDCAPARADIRCSDCPPPSPCGPSDQAIFGRVTCLDAGGQPEPMASCDVRVECAGLPPVTTTTDANGNYAACLPCAGCGFAVVTPLCCGSPITVPLDPGSCLPVRQDVDCGACIPPRPCPGPPSILVDGALACAQGNGMTPLANSVVILQALDASGDPLADVVTALTDGAGRYRACVPCPVGIAEVHATSPGCNASSQAPAADCPETLSLDTMLCADCSPCPPGSTRLQGQIHCRGGGPVANCAIRVVVTTCSDSLVLDATTDAQGKYKLCVPCPCDDTDVRVTALCCNASRAVHVDRCGPITPLPALFCPSPCR